jgi:NAD(P)-dependent dehydrogenase (short-subunit alcohol dehydrogenase family)
MVALSEVHAANAALKTKHESRTAVFVGATAGIGLATLRAFAKHTPKPTALIVGRSRAKFEPELENLKTINPNGTYTFLESDISLMKNIDSVCAQIKSSLGTSKIDLLYTSQGYLNLGARELNSEGLEPSWATRYYGRVRFTQNLLPLMSRDARAVTILAGGQEGKIFEDDMDLEKNWGIATGAGHYASLLTLSYDAFAKEHPEMGFIHVFPGLVRTGLLGNSEGGILGFIARWIAGPLIGLLLAKSPEEIGERMLYYGTVDEYGKGSRALDWDGTVKEVDALKEYRQRGFEREVVDYNTKVFERISQI